VTFKISVRADVKKTKRSLSRLQRTVLPASINGALNKTAKKVQTKAIKLVSKEVGLPQKEIRAHFSIVKSNFTTLRAIVISRRRAYSLYRFQARQTKDGVTANAWGQRKTYKHAFIVRNQFVAIRKKGGGLKALHGPSIPVEHSKDPITRAQSLVVGVDFPLIFRRELTRRVARL